MKYYHALKNSAYNFRIDLGKLGFIFSLVAIGYVSSISNTPCLEAQSTCAVGSNPVFSENINIKGGTAFQTTIDGSNITADRTLTLADADMDLSNALVATGALTNNTPLKIDSGGNVVTQDLVPETDLTIGSGTAGQMLAVNSGGTALEFANTYSPPVLTASKVMATDGAGAFSTTDVYPLSLTASKSLSTNASGNLETNDVYPLSLTASTPLKTNGSGEVTASDLDITTDITPGSALQEIRVNSGGTALEYFTPSGGSDVTKVASGNIIMNSAFGTLPQTGANICWFTQAGTLDDTKTYKLVVNFKLNENEHIQSGSSSTDRMYINTLWKQSWATDCGDTTNNNNGANYIFWSMTQNMPWEYSPNNSSFTNGYAKSSGTQYEDCCVPIMPYAYNSSGSGVNGTHLSANQLIVEFSPAQDSVLSSGYKIGATGSYTSNGMVTGTYNNPTMDNYAGWQVMGNFTNPGATQNNTTLANELKFEDFQGFKLGCNSNQCFGGDTTWALYEFSH